MGFVSDQNATPHAGRIVLGAQAEAARHDLLLLMLNTGGDPELERKEIELLLQRQVDGVLYASMYHRVVEVPEELRSGFLLLTDVTHLDTSVSAGQRFWTLALEPLVHRRWAGLWNVRT
ncbi:hypothetical protein HEP87_40350 [Streptomyces sp. S1D4-11]|nr:hypothetical protein [Streptomyces sp. S1D4-11]